MLTTPPVFSAPPPYKIEKGCKLVNGTRLYYEVRGEGQPLVFIHGYTLDNRMWDDQFYFFSKSYRCIRYDIRGYGQSALPGNEPHTFQEDLKSLLISLDVHEPVIVVGHSMGGLIATNFALQYPRFVKAMVLAGTQIGGHVFKGLRLENIFNSARKKGIDYAKRKWSMHELFAPAKKNRTIAVCLEQMIDHYSGWHFVDKDPALHFNPHTTQPIKNLTAPALVIYGELDLPDFKEMSEGAALDIPGAKKVMLPNTGHMSNMENPAAFNKELRDFFEGLPG